MFKKIKLTIYVLFIFGLGLGFGLYGLPMYNAAVVENARHRQELVAKQKRIERSIKDSQRGFLGKVFIVPARDLINKF